MLTAEMDQAGVADDDDMDLEEQGPTKVVYDTVGGTVRLHGLDLRGAKGGGCRALCFRPWGVGVGQLALYA